MRAAALVIVLAAAALAAAQPAAAQPAAAQDDDRVPGFSKVEAQILARPADGQYIARARADVFRRELEAGIARLCGAPARATPLFRDRDRVPGDVTYLVRCRP